MHVAFSRPYRCGVLLQTLIRTNSSYFSRIFGSNQNKCPENAQSYGTEATITLENAFKLHDLSEGPSTSETVTQEQAKKYYHDMQSIRRLEAVCNALYKSKIIRGFCHLYTGQEAVAVGMKAAMRENDNVITAYRCHGWSYLLGIPAYSIVAELAGRSTGAQRGKGGSMHMYSKHFFGGNGIVGAQVPLGVGIALATQQKKIDSVCIALYGDGAANQGQIFEAYNIACLLKIPVIFVCENNGYGMGTKDSRSSCNTEYYKRGFYIPGIWMDGMNVLAVRSATKFAIDYALKTGPIVLEAHTYRYMGHSMSDPGTSYRSREEVQEVREKRDPIALFREICISKGLLTEEETKQMDGEIRKEMEEIGEKAKGDKEIELKELTTDIYSSNVEPKIRGVSGFNLEHYQLNKGVNH